jgi:GDPmannose 4,6-dehydratase
MWLMLQQPEPDDYVVATGETHSVREFAEAAFACAGLDYRKHTLVDQNLFRPAEVNILLGDASKARKVLGWRHTIGFQELVREMVESECRLLGVEGMVRSAAQS